MNRGERRRRTFSKVIARKIFAKEILHQDLSEKRSGRCKKHHPCDCGKKDCFTCHCDKLKGKRRFNKLTDEVE